MCAPPLYYHLSRMVRKWVCMTESSIEGCSLRGVRLQYNTREGEGIPVEYTTHTPSGEFIYTKQVHKLCHGFGARPFPHASPDLAYASTFNGGGSDTSIEYDPQVCDGKRQAVDALVTSSVVKIGRCKEWDTHSTHHVPFTICIYGTTVVEAGGVNVKFGNASRNLQIPQHRKGKHRTGAGGAKI
ncbi:hypothetical protein BD779DRAFT_1471703 [Infundibulicybe gibba]|nr:hypothetical protein BD779DRAFT_1471703 [Infundibulicybe gibba]